MEPRLTLDSLSRDCRDPCFTRSEVKEGQSGLYSLDLEVLPLPVLGFSWVLAQERRHSLEMETVWGLQLLHASHGPHLRAELSVLPGHACGPVF